MAKGKKPAKKQVYKKATFHLDAYTDPPEPNSGVATGGGSFEEHMAAWRRKKRGR